MESTTSVWYPGRLCLVGEHCDWAGGSSLAVPLEQGTGVAAERGHGGARVSMRTVLDGTEQSGDWPCAGHVDRDGGLLRFVPAALHLLTILGLDPPPSTIEVSSDLPTGRGFSSSATFTLAILDALARLAGHTLSGATLARMAFDVEHELLGVECGQLDQLACASRAPVLIDWDTDDADGYQLQSVAPGMDFHLLVGVFPAPRDTRAILAALNGNHADGGEFTGPAFAVFAESARSGAAALASGDARQLGAEMNRAQTAYETYLERKLPELAAPGLRKACHLLRKAGALGSKFSGAGGDGSVVGLFENAVSAASAAALLDATLGLSVHHLVLRPPS